MVSLDGLRVVNFIANAFAGVIQSGKQLPPNQLAMNIQNTKQGITKMLETSYGASNTPQYIEAHMLYNKMLQIFGVQNTDNFSYAKSYDKVLRQVNLLYLCQNKVYLEGFDNIKLYQSLLSLKKVNKPQFKQQDIDVIIDLLGLGPKVKTQSNTPKKPSNSNTILNNLNIEPVVKQANNKNRPNTKDNFNALISTVKNMSPNIGSQIQSTLNRTYSRVDPYSALKALFNSDTIFRSVLREIYLTGGDTKSPQLLTYRDHVNLNKSDICKAIAAELYQLEKFQTIYSVSAVESLLDHVLELITFKVSEVLTPNISGVRSIPCKDLYIINDYTLLPKQLIHKMSFYQTSTQQLIASLQQEGIVPLYKFYLLDKRFENTQLILTSQMLRCTKQFKSEYPDSYGLASVHNYRQESCRYVYSDYIFDMTINICNGQASVIASSDLGEFNYTGALVPLSQKQLSSLTTLDKVSLGHTKQNTDPCSRGPSEYKVQMSDDFKILLRSVK